MSFPEWFEASYRRILPGGKQESRYRAIHRMAHETGLGWTTILRAADGFRVRAESAERLAGETGGAVSKESLVFAPSRKPAEAPQ